MINDLTSRTATPRSYLMCPPDHFDVTYAINPWMRPDAPVDPALAMRQWETLKQTYESLGHSVSTIEPVVGTAGHGVRRQRRDGDRRRRARRAVPLPQRAGEAEAYLNWFRSNGWQSVHEAEHANEGEGDILVAGDGTILAGYGFRSDFEAGEELAATFGRRVVSLRLVDPRFYHLDTALCVLDGSTAMYYPAAFDDAGRAALASTFAELIEAKDEDAEVLGLNAVSDGRRVVLAAAATGLGRSLRSRGFEVVPVDMSELLKAGGGAKCCTLELRR